MGLATRGGDRRKRKGRGNRKGKWRQSGQGKTSCATSGINLKRGERRLGAVLWSKGLSCVTLTDVDAYKGGGRRANIKEANSPKLLELNGGDLQVHLVKEFIRQD